MYVHIRLIGLSTYQSRNFSPPFRAYLYRYTGIVYSAVLYTVAMWCTLYLPFENKGINTPIVEHNKRHARYLRSGSDESPAADVIPHAPRRLHCTRDFDDLINTKIIFAIQNPRTTNNRVSVNCTSSDRDT